MMQTTLKATRESGLASLSVETLTQLAVLEVGERKAAAANRSANPKYDDCGSRTL